MTSLGLRTATESACGRQGPARRARQAGVRGPRRRLSLARLPSPSGRPAYSTPHDDSPAPRGPPPTHGGDGDARLRPQRGRLRGARRAAGRRAASPLVDDADRGRRPWWSTPAASSRRPRRTPSTRCSQAADLKGDGPHPGRRGRRLPGRAVRQASWPSRCPRPTRCSASTTTPTSRRGCARSLAGERPAAHTPQDRRRLLPISPVERAPTPTPSVPGHGLGRPVAAPPRHRPDGGRSSSPAAATVAARSARSLASAAPSSAAGPPTCSRRPAGWPGRASRELFLVSENSTSYGKDLGDLRLLETLLPELAAVDGVERVRVSYLQPAEMRPA